MRRDGPLTAARVVHILRQVCESLEEAHDAGLVHRDIKPANIHLGRVGREPDFVKVLDFGLVKSVEGAGGDDPLATIAGMTLGTPAYMAPEMVQSETIDGRADLYSLGCVAYFLLTGQLVFQGDTAIQTMFMHIQQEPVPPSQRTENPIPPALERLILTCLAKQPEDRPASAADLAAGLAQVEGAGRRSSRARGREAPAEGAYASTSTLNPPYAIRFRSNGIGSFIIFAMRGSFITFAFTRSRWARDLYTIHEKQTVSPLFALASRGKAIPISSSGRRLRIPGTPGRRARARSCPARCAMRR